MPLSHLSPSEPKRSLVLLSGGIESSTLLHLEARRGDPIALFIDYGQRAARPELVSAQSQCDVTGAPLRTLDLKSVGDEFRSDQTHKLHVPLPHRNLVILGLSVSFAAQSGISDIHIALNREDRDAYSSASDAFIRQFRALSHTLGEFEIHTPLASLNKAQVISRGLEIGIDYARTYSCLLGYPSQCGACPQCQKRRAAFATLGMPDPAGFKRAPQ